MARRKWQTQTWKHWRKGAYRSLVLCGGPTPRACSSDSSLRVASCTHCTSSMMVSRCPGLSSASSGLVPTRWTALFPGPQRRRSSPSSWCLRQPSAWSWTWQSSATSSAKRSWGARPGLNWKVTSTIITPTAWGVITTWCRTRRTTCCSPPRQIQPATRPCVEGGTWRKTNASSFSDVEVLQTLQLWCQVTTGVKRSLLIQQHLKKIR